MKLSWVTGSRKSHKYMALGSNISMNNPNKK